MSETRGGTTPGPWTFEQVDQRAATDLGLETPAFWIVGDYAKSDEVVATVQQVTVERALADARLIAAAPDLLAVLKAVVVSARPNPVDHPSMCAAWDLADIAIAKAEGRS